MLPSGAYTLNLSTLNYFCRGSLLTFCEFTARLSCAKSDEGSTVPRNIDLYWFIPALANSKVGSEWGTTEEEGTVTRFSNSIPDILGQMSTKSMAILLEIVYESLSYSYGGPLLIGAHLGENHVCCSLSQVVVWVQD